MFIGKHFDSCQTVKGSEREWERGKWKQRPRFMFIAVATKVPKVVQSKPPEYAYLQHMSVPETL